MNSRHDASSQNPMAAPFAWPTSPHVTSANAPRRALRLAPEQAVATFRAQDPLLLLRCVDEDRLVRAAGRELRIERRCVCISAPRHLADQRFMPLVERGQPAGPAFCLGMVAIAAFVEYENVP